MSTDSQLATAPVTPGFHKATTQLSTTLGIEPRMMVDTLKKQCFPSMRAEDVSDAQLAAFISVANAMDLNPLIPGMLYAYPGKNGGIVPVTGPDGVLKKLDEEITKEKIDGYECTVFPEDVTLPPTHATAIIHRKGKDHPAKFTAIFKEWVVGSNPNWAARPRHMIWLRAIKQCARQVIHGVPFDEDDMKIGDMVNVTPQTDAPPPERPAPPPRIPRAPKGVNAIPEKPAQSPAIEAEIVPPVATPAPKAEKPAEAPAPEPAPVAPETPNPSPIPPVAAPRTSLADKEKLTVTAKVGRLYTLMQTVKKVPTPAVQAVLEGNFVGTVHHLGGATMTATGLVANPPWAVGATLSVTMHGLLNPAGVVLSVVDSVEALPESPVGVEME